MPVRQTLPEGVVDKATKSPLHSHFHLLTLITPTVLISFLQISQLVMLHQ